MDNKDIHVIHSLAKIPSQRIDQFGKFGRNVSGIQFSLDRKNLRMTRVSHRKMDKRDAWIRLLSSSRDNLNLMACVGHQVGMVPQNAFDSPNDRRRRIMEESHSCHCDFSRAACIARSMNTAEDQPNMEAAFGGFSPLSG